jgi:Kdo2-lipid IVA lauroyltransferase/acyltransferase
MFSMRIRLPKISLSLSKFLQMRFNSILFRFLPFSVSRAYVMVLGRLYYLLNWSDKTLIRKTIEHVFKRKVPAPILKKKIKAAFKGIFDHYHEKLFVGYSNFPKLLKFLKSQVNFAGKEHLEAALEEGKGVILVTGHFGAVEMLPGSLVMNGFPTAMICRFQTNRLRESLGSRAESIGLNLLDADHGNVILAAMKALKAGQILITECDEFDEWRHDPHRDSYFLNNRLAADRTLELLRKRSGAQVITALVKREGNKEYTCSLTPVGNGAFPANMPISDRCLSVLETAVEDHPEQWYQWKKFGKMVKSHFEADYDRHEAGYLAPEIGFSVPDQA